MGDDTYEKEVEIQDYEEKTGTQGPYTRFKTDLGWMSAFDTKTFTLDDIDKIKEFKGQKVVLKILDVDSADKKRKFHNIKGFADGDDEETIIIKPGIAPEKRVQSVEQQHRTPNELICGDLTRYAKDILCAMIAKIEKADQELDIGTLMASAIKVTKQAWITFEKKD